MWNLLILIQMGGKHSFFKKRTNLEDLISQKSAYLITL